MEPIIQLMPNKWVTEQKLIDLTGLRPGTIMRARRESWMAGREYMHISPDGNPKANSECLYNRDAINNWIERQAAKQPGVGL